MRREWEMLRNMIEELRAKISEERTERTAAENRMTAKLEDERKQRVAVETRLMQVLNTEMNEWRDRRDDADSPRSVQAADRRRDDGNGTPQRGGVRRPKRGEKAGRKRAYTRRITVTRHESQPTGANKCRGRSRRAPTRPKWGELEQNSPR
ncbi:unnamed protein product, partial [Ixodes hexagonus]